LNGGSSGSVGGFSKSVFGFDVVDQIVFFISRSSESFKSSLINFFLTGLVSVVDQSEQVLIESGEVKNVVPFSLRKSSWDFFIESVEKSVSPKESSESFEGEFFQRSEHLLDIKRSKSAG